MISDSFSMVAAASTFGALCRLALSTEVASTHYGLHTSGCAFLFSSNGAGDAFLPSVLEFLEALGGSLIFKTSGIGSSGVAVTLSYTLWSGTSLQTEVFAFLLDLGQWSHNLKPGAQTPPADANRLVSPQQTPPPPF